MNHSILTAGGLSLLAFLLSWAGVGRFRRWAERREIIDIPNERSSHIHPTPRGGGLVIVIVALVLGCGYALSFDTQRFWKGFLLYLAGAVLISSVSWLEDLRPLPRSLRLAAHILAALTVIAGMGSWRPILPSLQSWDTTWIGVAFTLFWIVGLTNAFNFMDGIDGIAAGQSVVAGFGWSVAAYASGQPLLMGIGAITAASCLGFLVHNWSPARIFMGDVGSAFLGFTFATLPLMQSFVSSDYQWHRYPLMGVTFVWPFVFDTAYTMLRRLLRGENIFSPHRFHVYQRMVQAGRGHGTVASLYIALALVGTLIGIFSWL